MELSRYFSEPYLQDTLDSYMRKFGRRWSLPEKLRAYNIAKFVRTADANDGNLLAETSKLFDIVWCDWGAGNNATGAHWSASEFSHFVTTWGPALRFESGANFSTASTEAFLADLRDALHTLGSSKVNSTGYPWVAASKFLHVLNPATFPIYDIRHVWNNSLFIDPRRPGVFASDYLALCDRKEMEPDDHSLEFNVNYVLYCAEHIEDAPSGLMKQFGDWFRTNTDGADDPYGVLNEVEEYTAVAFEAVLLGATYLHR